MANFIELTGADSDGKILLNTDMIRSVDPDSEGGTTITFLDGDTLEVVETYKDIVKRLLA
jgi:hypothetical protein